MAVYTHLAHSELVHYARRFGLGALRRARPIAEGSINSLYALDTASGRFALRILEGRPPRDAAFEAAALRCLAAGGLAVAEPRLTRTHAAVLSRNQRQQVSVFPWLPGRTLQARAIRPLHLWQVGEFLARMHLMLRGLRRTRANAFAPQCLRRLWERCLAVASSPQRRDLERLRPQLVRDFSPWLPAGLVHGDVFVDNVHFARHQLVAVLDFEMMAAGPWLYDIAVVVFAWCFAGARLNGDRIAALITGYETVRALAPIERRALYDLCQFAAARFTVSRFWDFEVRRRPEAHRAHKDYGEALERLLALRQVGAARFRSFIDR